MNDTQLLVVAMTRQYRRSAEIHIGMCSNVVASHKHSLVADQMSIGKPSCR